MRIFLGGTCSGYDWRKDLINLLDKDVDYFNPIVDDWNEEAKKREIYEREEGSDIVLYTITSDMEGIYSIAEVVDDSNKRPDKTIFCLLNDGKFNDKQINSFDALINMLQKNGVKCFKNLFDLSEYLNKLNKIS